MILSRVHLSRVIGPFFLGAVFMYSVQILYTYPFLEKYTSSHLRAIEVDRYEHGMDYMGSIPRQDGWKHAGRHHGKAHPGDKMTKKSKRKVHKQNKYKLMVEEVNHLIANDTSFENEDNELVIEPKLDKIGKKEQARSYNVDNRILNGRENNIVHRIPDNSEHIINHVGKPNGSESLFDRRSDKSDDVKDRKGDRRKNVREKIQHPPATREVKPIYNKDITIPRHKRYADEPIDTHTYNYLHKPNVCTKLDGRRLKVLLIFIVTTSPKNFERRMLIRRTYGNKRNWPVLSAGAFRTVFLLGAVVNKTLQNSIHNESETFRDILQEDFIDSYANLTLKTVMGLKWVTNYCRQAKYTMKIDDDSMIHQNRLLRVLKNATATNFTAAEALMDAPVLRNTSSKYYISEEYYPAPTYPPYLNGPGYLISTDLTEGLYEVAVKTPLFPWEDVFLGICLKELGVTPLHHHNFILIIAEESQIRNITKAVRLFKYFTVVSNLTTEYMALMWTNSKVRPTKDK